MAQDLTAKTIQDSTSWQRGLSNVASSIIMVTTQLQCSSFS
jgi:hypothetical protein